MQPCSFSSAQFRGARAMLGWSLLDLAKAAGVSVVAIVAIESRKGTVDFSMSRGAVLNALQNGGISFVDDEHGIGVVLKSEHL